MFRQTLSRSGRRLATLVAAGALTLGMLGVSAGAAGATVQLGPDRTGFAEGSAACFPQSHVLNIQYTVHPEFGFDPYDTSLFPQPITTSEWVEVYAYVKSSASGSWGAPVAHRSPVLASSPTTVLNVNRYGAAGAGYDVGFYVRFAYPGGQWTQWIWDRPSYVSTVNHVYSQGIWMYDSTHYGYCTT